MNINNSTPNKELIGTDDADFIKNSGAVVKIYAQDGKDTIDNSDNLVTISGGAGNDSVKNTGSNVGIFGDDGDDNILNYKEYNKSNDNVIIFGGIGNDSIRNEGGSNVIINGNIGNDYIVNEGWRKQITLSGGEGNDTIKSCGDENLISGGVDNDFIDVGYRNSNSNNMTISGDSGNDYVSLNKFYTLNTLIQYTYGDGDDTIFGFDENDTLQITTPKSFETMTGGNDLYFIFDKGSITLKNVSSANVVTISGGNVDDGGDTTTTTEETDTTSTPTVTSGNGGGDTIINNYYGDYIDNSNNNGTIIINSSVEGGVTNNTSVDNSQTIVISGNTWTYNGGNKVINNYQQGEVVELASDYKGIGLNGNSFYVNSSSGSLEIQNARDKFVGYSASGQMAAYSYVASGAGNVDGRSYDKAEIMIGADNANNQIFAGNAGSSLWGGSGGNDSMQGGNGYDEFFYAVGGGNDLIQNANNNDLINLASVNLSQIVGVNVNIGEVTINFVDGGNLRVQGDSSVGYQIAEGTFQVNQSTGQWSNK